MNEFLASSENFKGKTLCGKPVFDGSALFKLKATHGLPLSFALDFLVNEKNCAVDWTTFIEAARAGDWWDFQTIKIIEDAMMDAELSKEMCVSIGQGLQRYVMQHPNPKMNAVEQIAQPA